ncbi:MAG TPA: hypothetical protein EYO33_17745 [Phycisphaerales bacterium]|nr:hypothetical protein [Phycisphaerales bacterium]
MADSEESKDVGEQFQGLVTKWLDLSLKDKHPELVMQYQEGFRAYFALLSEGNLSQSEMRVASTLGQLVMAQGTMFQQRLIDLQSECLELRARIEKLESDR